MLTLGLSGNFSAPDVDLVPSLHWGFFHDSAACLVRDGVLLAAVEEERLNRIKKTTKFPLNAIHACLKIADCSPGDIDGVGFYFAEKFADDSLNSVFLEYQDTPAAYSRQRITGWLEKEFGMDVPDGKLHYSPHHMAHGMSAYACSGMKDALVVVIDGNGESECITVYRGSGGRLRTLAVYPVANSLGFVYMFGAMQLGYRFGDEYKIMGLAPYGDPGTYQDVFESLYTLHPDGQYELHRTGTGFSLLAPKFLEHGFRPRRLEDPLDQSHKDFAAGLQLMLERIVMHVLTHWAKATGLRAMALSGGVAHNSSLNGLIIRSGLFDEVFVHPASHDSGSAEGAALFAENRMSGATLSRPRLRSASLGPDLGPPEQVEKDIRRWQDLVDIDRPDDVVQSAARLLADGAVLGWAHGRSEFGPRALGNRSILADARPRENWTKINAMVKKREAYRPFAPVVTAEAARTYFELPETTANYEFMSYVVSVRPSRRAELGAVTHVDGTARLQVVDQSVSGRFHQLVSAFGELTGTPVLLNTSFNNNAEPIVQDVDDVIACYLTSGLDHVVIEDHLISRKAATPEVDRLVIRFRLMTRLTRTSPAGEAPSGPVTHEIFLDYSKGPRCVITPEMYELLGKVDGNTRADALGVSLTGDLRAELFDLWQRRLIIMTP
jgi:decarbamoylnovobiocin carbamoyltransferase/7-O-carbamoyltransferase